MTNIQIGRKVGRFLALFALLLTWTTVQAQFGAYERFAEVLVNSTYNSSDQPIFLPGHSNHSAIVTQSGNGTVSPILSLGGGTLELVIDYSPDPDFVGLDTVVVEVTVGGPPIPLANIYYAQFVLHVIPSIVTTEEDYYTVVKGSTANYLPVDSNDSSTATGLTLQGIPACMGGVVNLDNDSLYYSPNADFEGMAYLTYIVCDSVGTCRSEVVNICVVDTVSVTLSDTVTLTTAVTDHLTEFLPSSDFYSTLEPQHGTLEFIPNSDAVIYHPGLSVGMDHFEVSDGNSIRFYEVDVLQDQVNSFVFDDYVYVVPSDRIEFNVKANDRTGNFLIGSYSQPDHGTLTKIGNGQFAYVADSSFTGLVTFEYEICALQNCESGEVFITISEFEPTSTIETHELTGLKNQDLIINYDVPVNDYEFNLSSPATNGVVMIHAGLDTLSQGCVNSIGHFMITYTPDSGFEGFDEFTLTYCSSGDCTDVVVSVEVIEVVIYDTCMCQDQCVWPGDVNFDGIVNMGDLVSLGQVIGDVGVNRAYPDPSAWYGQYGDDWQVILRPEHLADEKHCDTDGDGIASISDTIAISTFYGAHHTLIPTQEVTIKPYAVGLELDIDSIPAIGDTITVFITIGNSSVPARNLSGVALNISFDPNTIDTSYTQISVVNENWLTREGMPLFMNKNDRVNFELGLSRIDKESPHGYGRVFAVDIIIDDDLDGLKPLDDEIPINIFVHDIVGLDGSGRTFMIPDQQLKLMARVEDAKHTETAQESFKVFPNPVHDQLTIELEHVNVLSYTIQNIQGQTMQSQIMPDATPLSTVSTSSLPTGIYVLKLQTTSGPKAAKFLKID